jgi:hypothetical protein
MRLFVSLCSLVRRHRLVAVGVLAVFGALAWLTMHSQAQVDPGMKTLQVIYDGDVEVGRVYRDGAGAEYTEHWVLYPNYTYDQGARPGDAIHIVAFPGQGYTSLADFLRRVPFPGGSRYVVVQCQEFDALPAGK